MLEILLQRSLKYSGTGLLRARAVVNSVLKSEPVLDQLYFAYGANLSEARLKAKALSVERVGLATAHGYAVKFNVPCEYVGQGFAGLARVEGAVASGVLFKIDRASLVLLDVMEWVPFSFYRREKISVESNGRSFEAWAYLPCFPREGLKPSIGYLRFMQASAKANGFEIAETECVSAPPLDHSFSLWNPGMRRVQHRYIGHWDRLRERVAAMLP